MLTRLPPAPAKPVSLPSALDRHLSAATHDDPVSLASYIERGADLVDARALDALRRLLPALFAKRDRIVDAEHLRLRLDLLAQFFSEAYADGHRGTEAHRHAAFALLYFLKGFDRVPDTVPEVGLLDDAMVVQLVCQRHRVALQSHWQRRGRTWPAGV